MEVIYGSPYRYFCIGFYFYHFLFSLKTMSCTHTLNSNLFKKGIIKRGCYKLWIKLQVWINRWFQTQRHCASVSSNKVTTLCMTNHVTNKTVARGFSHVGEVEAVRIDHVSFRVFFPSYNPASPPLHGAWFLLTTALPVLYDEWIKLVKFNLVTAPALILESSIDGIDI